MVEKTLSIIKPHAVLAGVEGTILAHIEASGLKIACSYRAVITDEQARKLYGVHAKREGYEDLIRCSQEGPAIIAVLEGENAVKRYRELMGNINSPKTLRGMFGEHPGDSADWICHNAVHGSDSVENAKAEIGIFFPQMK